MTGADLVVVGARVYGSPGCNAVAVSAGRVCAIGLRSDVRDWRGSFTQVIELPGATLLPGLVDAHTHPVLGIRLTRGSDLRHVHDLDGLRLAITRVRETTAEGDWLLGWGLDHSVWGAHRISAAVLDEIAPDVPVLVRMFDAHSAVANSVALRQAGVSRPISFDNGASVVADSHGRPSGLLLEEQAIELVSSVVPPEAAQLERRRLGELLANMAASGLTGAHVMDFEGEPAHLLRSLESEGLLPLHLRCYPWVHPTDTLERRTALAAQIGEGGERWGLQGVKAYLDGTIDGGTAWLTEPDLTGGSLRSGWPGSTYSDMVAFFATRGIGVATHAIGDAAIRHAAAVAAVAQQIAPHVPQRIEHLELMDDDTVRVVAGSGATASMQPTHCTHFVRGDGSDNWSRRLGPARARNGWRLSSVAEWGANLCLGSDWPVAPFEPLPIIADAMLRRTAGRPNEAVVGPSEGIGLRRAIDAYTAGPARAIGHGTRSGKIALGMLADFTIVGADIEQLLPDEIAEATIAATVVEGRVAFQSV